MRLKTAALIGVSALIVASCGDAIQPGFPGVFGPPPEVTITIPPDAAGTLAFGGDSAPLVVSSGTSVRWINQDTKAHTITSNNNVWDSGAINAGASYSFTFDTVGSYSYFCKLHPSEIGVVIVQASNSSIPLPSASPTPAVSTAPAPAPTPLLSPGP